MVKFNLIYYPFISQGGALLKINFSKLHIYASYIMYVENDVVSNITGDRRSRDHMVVGFTTTCAISAYHH